MNSKPKSPPRSISFVWMMVIILIISVVSAFFTAILVYYRSTDIMEATDARLLMAAEMSWEILGSDYHDQIDSLSSVSAEKFARIVKRNDDLCRRLGLQYLWSVLQVHNNKLVFTSATHSDINDSASPCASFFETHRDPQAFAPAIENEMKPSFSSFHNEWGAGRMVLVPRKDSRGRTYIFGASIRLAEYDAIVRQSLLATLAIWLAVMCIAFPGALSLSRRLISPIAGLTNAADLMASGDLDAPLPSSGPRELQSLSHSFDRMRRELKQQTEELRESEHKYRSLLSRLPIGAYRNTPGRTGRFIMANEAIAKMFGYESPEQFIQTNVSDLYMDPAEREIFSKQFIAQNGVDAVVLRLKKKDGLPFLASVKARVVRNNQGEIEYFDGIIEDITQRKRAEEERERLQAQLNQAQKMEAIGTLAGGIAHNFNNILMGIQGRASLMTIDKGPSHPDVEHLKAIEDSVRNGAELTKGLLGFARGGKYEMKPTEVNALIKHETRMFGRTEKEIQVHGKYENGLWTVEVDRGQIQQALLNLYVNALQAMPGGGDLYIQTENVTIDDEYIKPLEVTPGRYVKISVTDTGTGMDEATRENIFDPFFTTKEIGQGSGLGLASVYGIIKNHAGFINVYSKKGEGTTFNIYLPASEKELVEEAPRPVRPVIHYGQDMVLLVDDEDMVIDVAQKMLEKLGYCVLTARSGKQALDVYGKQKGEIGLVILDMVMPGMGGGETYDRMKAMDGDVRVLLSSGYSINGQAKEIMDRGCIGFIQKPFSFYDFSNKVREVLEETK